MMALEPSRLELTVPTRINAMNAWTVSRDKFIPPDTALFHTPVYYGTRDLGNTRQMPPQTEGAARSLVLRLYFTPGIDPESCDMLGDPARVCEPRASAGNA